MEELINLATGQERILSNLNLKVPVQRLIATKTALKDTTFRILIVGEFGRGKSTLLNALIGEDILKTSLIRVPVTNIIRNGQKKAAFTIQEGKENPVDWQTIRALEDDKVAIECDLSFLGDKIELIEYPSMSEAPDKEAFEKAIMHADLVVFIVAADTLYSGIEANIYKNYLQPNGHKSPLFIVNFIDRITKKDLEEIKRAAIIRLPVNQDRIFFISAQAALENEPDSTTVLTAFKNKLTTEASDRLLLKRKRLQLVTSKNLEIAFLQLGSVESDTLQKQTENDKTILQLRKNLKRLQNLSIRIQQDLVEFRNGTRDVLEGKIKDFLHQLILQVEDWGQIYQGNDLTLHLNEKIQVSITEFTQKDFKNYLEQRLQEQEDLLNSGFLQYQQEFEKLYLVLKQDLPPLNMDFKSLSLTPNLNQMKVSADPSKNTKGFEIKNLIDVPEAMATLIGSAVGSVFYLHLAPVLIPIGLGASYILASRKKKKQDSITDLATYKIQIREQGKQLETQVLKHIITAIDQLQTSISKLINNTTDQAQKDVLLHIDSLQKNNTETTNDRQQLMEIQQALESLK